MPATPAGRRVAGAAPRSATGWAGRLSGRVGHMQLIVAEEARAPNAQAPVARRWLHETDRRVPVEAHQLLALAAFDQHLKALHRHEQLKSLHPFDAHAQRVIVAQVAELGRVLPLDRRDAEHLPLAVIFRLFARTAGKRCELLLRQEMQIAVVLMDPIAVAVEATSHGA